MAVDTTPNMGLHRWNAAGDAYDWAFDLKDDKNAIDAHDHSNTKGVPVRRVAYGAVGSRPAHGNAGHLFFATDEGILYLDTGAAWTAAAKNPMTTAGDLVFGGVGGVPTRLAAGAVGTVPYVASGGVTYAWGEPLFLAGTQTMTGNKILNGTLTLSGGSLIMPQAPGYAATAEGQLGWDSDQDRLTCGANGWTAYMDPPRAWGFCDWSGNILSGYGMNSISYPGTGIVALGWTRAFRNNYYGIHVTPINDAVLTAWVPHSSKSTGGARLQFKNSSFIDTNATAFMVSAYGLQ